MLMKQLHVAQVAHLVQDAQDAPHVVLRLRIVRRSAASSFCLRAICSWASAMSRLSLVQLDDHRLGLQLQGVDVVQDGGLVLLAGRELGLDLLDLELDLAQLFLACWRTAGSRAAASGRSFFFSFFAENVDQAADDPQQQVEGQVQQGKGDGEWAG